MKGQRTVEPRFEKKIIQLLATNGPFFYDKDFYYENIQKPFDWKIVFESNVFKYKNVPIDMIWGDIENKYSLCDFFVKCHQTGLFNQNITDKIIEDTSDFITEDEREKLITIINETFI